MQRCNSLESAKEIEIVRGVTHEGVSKAEALATGRSVSLFHDMGGYCIKKQHATNHTANLSGTRAADISVGKA